MLGNDDLPLPKACLDVIEDWRWKHTAAEPGSGWWDGWDVAEKTYRLRQAHKKAHKARGALSRFWRFFLDS